MTIRTTPREALAAVQAAEAAFASAFRAVADACEADESSASGSAIDCVRAIEREFQLLGRHLREMGRKGSKR